MDLRRLREGDWIMGGFGLLLLIALFLPWYDAHASAWEAFTILDVLLAAGALAAIAVVIVTAVHATPALPLTMESLVTLLAIVLLILVLYRLADPPGDDLDRAAGAWLGLAATLGIVVGGLLAMRDERRSPAGRHTDLTGVPVDSPPEIETIPAPRPESGS